MKKENRRGFIKKTGAVAAESSHLNHLANIAYQTALNLKVDPNNGHIPDDAIMKLYWTRDYEPGWEPKL